MNFLRPLLIGTFAFFALNLTAQAQEASGENSIIAQYSQARIDMIAAELSLTSDQVAQIEALNAKVIEKIQAIQNNTQWDDAKKREFIRGNRDDHKYVMSTILTTQQFEAYLELMKGRASDRTDERIEHKEIKTN